jgi:NitT/TauT family transport system permease protein
LVPSPVAGRPPGSVLRASWWQLALRRWWPPAVFGLAALILWELISQSINPLLFAAPSRTVEAFGELILSGELLDALIVTLSYLVPGLLISVVLGIALGIFMGRSVTWGTLLQPYLDAIYALPRVAIIPLVILWFGVGYEARIFIIVLGSVVPIAMSTSAGVRYTSVKLLEAARSFQATELQIIRHVVIPSSIPFIISGLRIGTERALVGAVIAEVFLSLTGLGGIIQTEAERFNAPYVIAAALVYALLGGLSMTALGAIERRIAAWKAA